MPGPMRRPAVSFLAAVLLALAPASLASAAARVLDLPLYEPARGQTAVPAYDARRFVLEMKPGGPRLLAPPVSLKGARAETEAQLFSIRPTSTGVAAIDQLDASYGVVALEPLFRGETSPDPASGLEDLTRFYIVELPAGADLASALGAYAALPEVASAEPSAILPVSFVPNDPLTTLQLQLGQPNDHDSDVYEAWDTFQGDSTIVIAIVDTGVLYYHDDLGGSSAPYTAGNIWTNYAELGGAPGVDDDGNGFIDDFRGWDFVAAVAGAAGEDLSTPDNDPKDWNGHGTFCSGMASARTNNGIGIAGTAFRAKIMPVRAGWDNGTNGVVDLTWCSQAINYAVQKGANVINCSWSNSSTPVLTAAVNNAIAKGVTVCVAAGNDNTQSQASNFLSTRGDCVDVASINSNDERSGFSNFGSWIDVSAAGESVTSTYSNHYTAAYATGSGTSYSSPFTAGAVALFQGYRRSQGKPLYNAARMLLRLRETGDDIDALNPAFQGALGARLNVNRLLNDPPTSWVDVLAGNLTTSPALVDLDGDGDDEVVIGGSDGKLFAFGGADGDTIPGWPVALASSINSSPAVWDVDLDGHPDVLVGTNAGKLWAVHGNGTSVAGWPVQLSGSIYGGPAVGDIASPAGFEACVVTEGGNVYVLDALGNVMPGWPKHVNQAIYATPALHDFDGDGLAEIVVGAYDSTLYVWHGDGTTPPGWPIKLGLEIYSSAAIGDVDHDGPADIIVGCNDAKVYGFHYDGSPLLNWPVTVAGSVRGSPALADLWNNDGQLEVAIATDGPTLYVIRGDGTFAPGWPQALGGPCIGGVVIGNMDTDPGLELAVGTTQKQLYVFDADGQIKLNYPRLYEGAITGTPTLGDPDKDGRAELLFGDASKRVRALDFGPATYNAGIMPWPTMHRDFLRRGSVSNLLVAAPPAAARVRGLAFAPSPNPSRGAMRLVFTRDGDLAMADPDAPVGVRIVAINGTIARSLVLRGVRGPNATLVWDGNDSQGRTLPPGMYFIVANWGDASARGRIVRL